MEKGFWLKKWDDNQIGFHEEDYNPNLVKFWPQLASDNQLSTILVPLCGKTKDILYLAAQGHKVIGVELSELAAKSFFEENQLAYQEESHKDWKRFTSDNISILVTDLLKIDLDLLKDCNGFYDRASVVALPLVMRKEYIQLLLSLPHLKAGLMIAMSFDDNKSEVGPPFSMDQADIKMLFDGKSDLEELSAYTETGEDLSVHKGKISKRVEYALAVRLI